MYKHNWISDMSTDRVLEKDALFWKTLSEKAYPVTHGEISIPISLEPFIIKEKEYRDFYHTLQLFISAAQKIATQWFNDEEIKKIVVINEQERLLIEESADEDFVGIIRPDLFWSETPRLVEINADFPDGFFMHDVTATAILDNVGGKHLFSSDHSQLFGQFLEEHDLDKDQHVFVGYNKDRFFVDEFYLTKLQLAHLGWKNISVGALEDLSFQENKFYYDGRRVDVIRRGAELFKLRKIPGLIEKMIASQRAGEVRIVNNFKNRLLGHKSLLAALCDERFHVYLEQREIDAIHALLPKTVKLSRENVAWAKENKDTLVLKPSDLAEGEGVFVGIALDQERWDMALDRAVHNFQFWIIQERISIPEVEFTLVDRENKKMVTSKKKYDFDPHLIMFNDRVEIGKILVRFSESSILNVMQGGGLTYAYIEKESAFD